MTSEFAVYILQSIEKPNRTYVGYTRSDKIKNRLRQHNGEICGGAKYTKAYRPWKMVCYVTGFKDKSHAMQLEWKMHHPPKGEKTYSNRLEKRLKDLENIMSLDCFTTNAPLTKNYIYEIHWICNDL